MVDHFSGQSEVYDQVRGHIVLDRVSNLQVMLLNQNMCQDGNLLLLNAHFKVREGSHLLIKYVAFACEPNRNLQYCLPRRSAAGGLAMLMSIERATSTDC